MTMKIGQFLDMLIEEPNTIIVVYPNGYEEEYEDFLTKQITKESM